MQELILKIDTLGLEVTLRQIIQQEVAKAIESWGRANLKSDNANGKLLNTKEVCAYLQVSRGTLIKLVKEENLVSRKVGNKRLFTQASIEKYLEVKPRKVQ